MAIRGDIGRRRIGAVRITVAGLVGAVVMIPPGVIAGLLGFQVNKFGELLARQLTGGAARPVLLVEHLLIGATRTAYDGLAYGTAFWLVANTVALPLLFGQPGPWSIGPSALLPSLIVHMVYGISTGLVLATARPEVKRP